ncbi:MAG: hypothetical protein ACYSUK_04050 [Planctomycetota bacterium]
MIKKIMIAVIVAVLCLGVGILIAQEDLEKPGVQRQQQKQVQQKRRQGSGAQKAPAGKARQARQEAGTQAGSRAQGQKPEANHPAGQQLSRVQMFQRWFGGLKKAYRENDRKKLGQLIRTMEQQQQQMRKRWQANMQHNMRPRQGAANHHRTGRRRRTWDKSQYRRMHRFESYARPRVNCRCCRDGDNNKDWRRHPRKRKGRQRPG